MKHKLSSSRILWQVFLSHGRAKRNSQFLKLILFHPDFQVVALLRIIACPPKPFRFLAKALKIGEEYIDSRSTDEYPIIRYNGSICSAALSIGKIRIGSETAIGAHVLVLNDIPSGSKMVGLWS